MEFLKIVVFSILCACLYGILHNQITARVCVEYFTIGHPPVFSTESVTLLALGWGIIATWWVGAILGCAIAASARWGNRPKLQLHDVSLSVLKLLAVMAVSALLAGVIGYTAGSNGSVFLLEPMASRVPGEKHPAFLADLWAHSASYLVGFIGGIVLCVITYKRRSFP